MWHFNKIVGEFRIGSPRKFFAKEVESIERNKSAWKVEDKSYVSRFISLGSCGWKTNKHVHRNGIVGASSSSANVGRLLLGVGVERCSPRWLARGLAEGPYPARGTTKFFSLHTSIDYFHAHYRQHAYICISLGSKPSFPSLIPRRSSSPKRGSELCPSPRSNTERTRDTRAARLSLNLTTFKLCTPGLFSLGRTERNCDDDFPVPLNFLANLKRFHARIDV